MTTDDLILTVASQANQLRLALEELVRLQRRITELEAKEKAGAEAPDV